MSCLSLISRTKHVFDKRSVLTILNALVDSKCFIVQTYGRIHKKSNVCSLQSTQNFAARIATRTRKYDHNIPVLKELKCATSSNSIILQERYHGLLMPYFPRAGVPFLPVHQARRNKRACQEKFTDAEHSTFKVCQWSEDVLLQNGQCLELHGQPS